MSQVPCPSRRPTPGATDTSAGAAAAASSMRWTRRTAAALEMLKDFDAVAGRTWTTTAPDETARASAAEIMAFFAGPARTHHADEEKLVFPALLNSSDVELVQHVRRLQQDHGWLEEDWRELAPQIEAIAKGYNWYDLAMLRTRCRYSLRCTTSTSRSRRRWSIRRPSARAWPSSRVEGRKPDAGGAQRAGA